MPGSLGIRKIGTNAREADLVLETSFLAFVLLIFFSHKACSVALFFLGLSWTIRRLAASPFLPSVTFRLPLLLFLVFLLLSALFSEDRPHSLQQFWAEVPKILVIFFGSLEYLRDRGRYRRLFWIATWVVLLIGLDGLVQFFHGQDLIRGAGFDTGRVKAHFSYPTFFEYVRPLLPLSLSLLEESTRWWEKGFVGLAAVSFAATSVLSQTRSVWIALSLIVLFMVLFSRYKVFCLLSIGFVIFALAILPVSTGRDRLFSMADFISEQRYQRILVWQISYRMFLSRPLLGKGLDFFEKYKRNAELQRPYLSLSLYERVKKGRKGRRLPHLSSP